jgi:hypothetical protein
LYLWKSQKQNQNVTKQASFRQKKEQTQKQTQITSCFSSLIVKLVSYCNSSQAPTEVTAQACN